MGLILGGGGREQQKNTWQINFLNDYLKIGLMCKSEQGDSGYIQESPLTEAIVETLC